MDIIKKISNVILEEVEDDNNYYFGDEQEISDSLINGNISVVKKRLSSLSPLEAAKVVANMLQNELDPEHARTLTKLLNQWS